MIELSLTCAPEGLLYSKLEQIQKTRAGRKLTEVEFQADISKYEETFLAACQPSYSIVTYSCFR